MFGLISCQGTFSLVGKCIAPSSGAEEQGQQECKGQQDLSLLNFCVVAVPGLYQF